MFGNFVGKSDWVFPKNWSETERFTFLTLVILGFIVKSDTQRVLLGLKAE